MDLVDIVVLAVIQGITEFLPISSSGHLALWWLGICGSTELEGCAAAENAVSMDVAVHLGTLVAVCAFFRAEFGSMIRGAGDILRGRWKTADARLAWLLALATVPAMAVGLGLKITGGQEAVRSLAVIGWATLIGGILLWLADRAGTTRGKAEEWTMQDAILMGLAQATALIPGVSRSGITMTAARWLGYDRMEAARLALLMAVPVILAAGTVEALGVIRDGDLQLGTDLALAALLSCLAAFAALWVMMRMFARAWTMLPFVSYRLVLGAVLLWLAYA